MSSTLEVEWDDVERDWMLALQHYRTEVTCALCGWPKEICRAYETDGNVLVKYERCHIATEIARKQTAIAKDTEYMEGLMYSAAVKRPEDRG